ncbi:hypothetical protein [Kingella negevensis]|uniref:hypothetical protein n=1 Tax=Kingella negevensis TaxID=1522312 RepID=UPI00050A3237|nr:hypothetical protein [Kingella negevensis]MDK4687856.1 hypothetical protein [Kingella negevensis]WII91149.1 hypothetical protein QEO93_00710 [Kingella negevensis]
MKHCYIRKVANMLWLAVFLALAACTGQTQQRTAYGNKRGVYVIKDSDTGREFVGISGVGIAELGSHANPSVKREVEQ